jgi:uncharacterized repeat protein (TIGR01451 family)
MGRGNRSGGEVTKTRGLFARTALLAVLSVACLALPRNTAADNCYQDVWYNGDASLGSSNGYIFPNWSRVFMGSYTLWLYLEDPEVISEYITGITIVNFGDAMQGTEISNVYIRAQCDTRDSGTITMTYVGPRLFDDGSGGTTSYPAWTWGGSAALNYNTCVDYCVTPACGGFITLSVYADIAPCPAQDTVVNLGFPTAAYLNPLAPGAIYDSNGCVAPWYESNTDMGADYDTIVWAYKLGPEDIGPGDTINYTIYFGRPGTGNLSFIDVTDTLPQYMHYLPGTGVPGR